MEKNPVNVCVEISDKLTDITQSVIMDNPNNNPFTDAFNKGVSALYGAFSQFLNAYAIAQAFKPVEGKKGE